MTDFVFQGQRYQKAGFRTKAEAIRWEAWKRDEIGAPGILTPTTSFQELATKYLDYCEIRMSKGHVHQKTFVYRSFLKSIGRNPAAISVTKQQILKYLEIRARKSSNKASNRDLRDLKALYNWGINNDIEQNLLRNPCRGIEPLPEEPYIPYVPPPADIAKVMMAADRDQRDFLECLYHLLARRSEILRLTWEDVIFEQRQVILFTRKRRGGSLQEQIKPMNALICKILKRRFLRPKRSLQSVFNFSGKQIRDMMPRLCRKAGVKPFGHHPIRHCGASFLMSAGVDIRIIQLLLGHKRQSTTEGYLHVLMKSLRDAVDLLAKK